MERERRPASCEQPGAPRHSGRDRGERLAPAPAAGDDKAGALRLACRAWTLMLATDPMALSYFLNPMPAKENPHVD